MGSIPADHTDERARSQSSESPKTTTIAVIGGGISGLCCAIGLLKHHHIDVQIYEAAHAFGEIGTGLTVGPNANRALELVGPGPKAAFDKCRTGDLWQSHANMYTENRVVGDCYIKGRVAILGDAAHATTPYQGQGAGQAIEDAMVLEALLGKTKSIEHIPDAFAAYDQIRRPRTQRMVTTSRESGQLLC
ncbi:MAG: hypothetical protein M1828_004561 [Chrysothrix sp. TS-e1954]|nr:MAG: hypothetical protein M1828_004561 [Chrysothrix sp. TS-e1954]